MNRKCLFTTPEPPPLATLEPTLVKVRPALRLVPTGYPMLLIPLADRPGVPDGPQRVGSALKDLLRPRRVRANWLPDQKVFDDEPEIGSSASSTRETDRYCRRRPRELTDERTA
jgi:hypothetical protein